MASYSVPQFLDSGEKIFFSMNIRQLGYFLVAFGICAGIYSFFNAIIPGLGVYALIPCIPVAFLGGYLSLGKFNGRDSEIYVLKLIIYLTKPRKMVFKRQPDYSDIIEKYKSSISTDALNRKYSKLAEKEKQFDSLINKNASPKDRIEVIRNLSRKVDANYVSSVIQYKEAEKLNQRRSEQIKKWNKLNKK